MADPLPTSSRSEQRLLGGGVQDVQGPGFLDARSPIVEGYVTWTAPSRPGHAIRRRNHDGALYERFPPFEARRILDRLEFHYTPKNTSCLNMVEIEIGVMVSQCLDRRIPDKATLVAKVASWERRRNAERARMDPCRIGERLKALVEGQDPLSGHFRKNGTKNCRRKVH